MPLIATTGDLTQGHCWLPATMESQINENVFVNGGLAIVVGDITMHPLSCTTPTPSTHPVLAMAGSPTVFINSIPVVRDGDPMGCGDAADTIAGSVYADGGGNLAQIIPGTPPVSATIGEQVGYTINAIGVTYSVTLEGNVDISVNGLEEEWGNWLPQALSPQPSNGFRITIKEEFTGRSFISYQSQGAPTLPSAAPPIYLQPLDPSVRFEMVTGPFTIDNAGTLTLIPTFIPPKEEVGLLELFVRVIPTTVKIIYGGEESKIDEEVSFDVILDLSY